MTPPPLRFANHLALILFLAMAYIAALGLVGSPNHGDFDAFWLAGRVAADGGNPYDLAQLETARLKAGLLRPAAPYFNPPPFLLLLTPLSRLPELWALAAWLVGGAALLWLGLRKVAVDLDWIMLLYPAGFWCATVGQTGFMTAALLVGAAVLMRPRPALAGLLIGCLIVKPQLALLAPVLLIRNWRAFAAAAGTVIGLWALAEALFPGATAAFLTHDVGGAFAGRDYLKDRLLSVYGAALQLSAPSAVAVAAQVLATLAAAAIVWTAGGSARTDLQKLAILAAAAPLATPYLFSYDLVLMVLPLALLARSNPWFVAAAFLASASGWALRPVPVEPLVFALTLWRLYGATAPDSAGLRRSGGGQPAEA